LTAPEPRCYYPRTMNRQAYRPKAENIAQMFGMETGLLITFIGVARVSQTY